MALSVSGFPEPATEEPQSIVSSPRLRAIFGKRFNPEPDIVTPPHTPPMLDVVHVNVDYNDVQLNFDGERVPMPPELTLSPSLARIHPSSARPLIPIPVPVVVNPQPTSKVLSTRPRNNSLSMRYQPLAVQSEPESSPTRILRPLPLLPLSPPPPILSGISAFASPSTPSSSVSNSLRSYQPGLPSSSSRFPSTRTRRPKTSDATTIPSSWASRPIDLHPSPQSTKQLSPPLLPTLRNPRTRSQSRSLPRRTAETFHHHQPRIAPGPRINTNASSSAPFSADIRVKRKGKANEHSPLLLRTDFTYKSLPASPVPPAVSANLSTPTDAHSIALDLCAPTHSHPHIDNDDADSTLLSPTSALRDNNTPVDVFMGDHNISRSPSPMQYAPRRSLSSSDTDDDEDLRGRPPSRFEHEQSRSKSKRRQPRAYRHSYRHAPPERSPSPIHYAPHSSDSGGESDVDDVGVKRRTLPRSYLYDFANPVPPPSSKPKKAKEKEKEKRGRKPNRRSRSPRTMFNFSLASVSVAAPPLPTPFTVSSVQSRQQDVVLDISHPNSSESGVLDISPPTASSSLSSLVAVVPTPTTSSGASTSSDHHSTTSLSPPRHHHMDVSLNSLVNRSAPHLGVGGSAPLEQHLRMQRLTHRRVISGPEEEVVGKVEGPTTTTVRGGVWEEGTGVKEAIPMLRHLKVAGSWRF